MPSVKHHLVAFLGEFIGTYLFLFFAFGGTQVAVLASALEEAPLPNVSQLLYVALIFGFSLAINVWVFFRVSGGLFNPAVTLALVVVGVVKPLRAISILVAQVTGAIAAAAAVRGLTPGNAVHFGVGLYKGISTAQGLFLEMFFTLMLVFAILMLAAEKTKATFVAPVGIGLALFVAELFGVMFTGGALNPARAFGPAVINGFDKTHWIYWVGPLLGALLAAFIYKLFKFLDYEDVNGNQDLTEDEERDLAEKEAERKKKRKMEKRKSSRSINTEAAYHKDDVEAGHRASVGSQHASRTPVFPPTQTPMHVANHSSPVTPRHSGQYSSPQMQYDFDGNPVGYQQTPIAPASVIAPSTGPYVFHQNTTQSTRPQRQGSRREDR